MHEDIPTTRYKKSKNNLRAKYGNGEWINNMKKQLQRFKKILLDSLRATLKKVLNGKTPGHDGIHGFWLKIIFTIHHRLTIEMNRYLEETRGCPRRCPWCNSYRRWKWTRRHKFKSWLRLIAFHIALILLGKVWIQLFSLQLWVNSRADWGLQPWWGN